MQDRELPAQCWWGSHPLLHPEFPGPQLKIPQQTVKGITHTDSTEWLRFGMGGWEREGTREGEE